MSSTAFSEKVKLNVAGHFDRSVEMYQAFEDRHHFFADLCITLARRIGLAPGSTVLDVGCGSGVSARILNECFSCRVLGVDLSAKMVTAGRSTLAEFPDIRLVVGDGEQLGRVVNGQVFDYVLYNASIFIFPNVDQTLREAAACLRPGGKIAFSFYPDLVAETGEDLLALAFERLGQAPPRFRVISGYAETCRALARRCGPVVHEHWARPLDIRFLQDFFSIPAQSASLFPGCDVDTRREQVARLFATLSDKANGAAMVWRMASGVKGTTGN